MVDSVRIVESGSRDSGRLTSLVVFPGSADLLFLSSSESSLSEKADAHCLTGWNRHHFLLNKYDSGNNILHKIITES